MGSQSFLGCSWTLVLIDSRAPGRFPSCPWKHFCPFRVNAFSQLFLASEPPSERPQWKEHPTHELVQATGHLVWPVTFRVADVALAAQHCHHRLFKGTRDVSEMSPQHGIGKHHLLDKSCRVQQGSLGLHNKCSCQFKNPQIQWGLLFWRSWPDFEVTLFSG